MGRCRLAWSEAFVASLLLLLINFTAAQRYGYPIPDSLQYSVHQDALSTMFTSGDALYMYGGINYLHLNGTNLFSRFSFDMVDNGLFHYQPLPPGRYATNAVKSVLVNNETAIIFATTINDTSSVSSFTVSEYSISNNIWSYPNISSYSFIPAYFFDATLASDGKVYITGGQYPVATQKMPLPSPDVWSYDPASHTFQKLTSQYPALVYHSGVALPDGTIVYLGGTYLYNDDAKFPDLASATIYTPSTDSWTLRNLTLPTDIPEDVELPEFPCSLNTVLGPEKRYIYVYGGDNGFFGSYYISYNAILVLDTKTWTWFVPDVEGVFPTKRTSAASALLNDKHFVIYGGYDRLATYYGELDVLLLPPQSASGDFNPSGFKWVVNLVTDTTHEEEEARLTSSSAKTARTVGAVVGSILAFSIICTCLFCFRGSIRRFLLNVHYSLWEPRTGEPIWTETFRLVTRVVLLFLFIAFTVILVLQVTGSAKATTIIFQAYPKGLVDTPDIRICTEGFEGPVISCTTTSGVSCAGYIYSLDLTLHRPLYAGSYPNLACFLFMPPPDFQLAEDIHPDQNDGFRIEFDVKTQEPATSGYTHITLYPTTRDPNRYVYFNQTDGFTDDEIVAWVNVDANDFTTTNILDLEYQSQGSIHYQMIEHQYLVDDDKWNYVGFKQHFRSVDEIQTEVHSSKLFSPDTSSREKSPNFFSVEPKDYQRILYREQYLYHLINVIGYLGGVFSFFMIFQELMFGYRPRSPWGVVHRWSTGNLRRSISRNLRSRFDALQTPVPLVNPVHRRFSTLNVKKYGKNEITDEDDYNERGSTANSGLMGGMDMVNRNHNSNNSNGFHAAAAAAEDDDRRRIEQVEERMQLLELLFKSYYVNDEIFRRLDKILRRHPEHDEHQPGLRTSSVVDRLFRRRQNPESTDDVTATLGPPTPTGLDETEAMRSLGHLGPTAADRDVERWAHGVSTGVSSIPWVQHTPSAGQLQQITENPRSPTH